MIYEHRFLSYVQNQSADLIDEEFAYFWSHIQNDHPDTYLNILQMCQAKISKISKKNSSKLPTSENIYGAQV